MNVSFSESHQWLKTHTHTLTQTLRRRRQPSSERGLQFPNEVRRQLANKESYYEPKLGQVQCSMQGGSSVRRVNWNECELCTVWRSTHVQCIDPVLPRPRGCYHKPPNLPPENTTKLSPIILQYNRHSKYFPVSGENNRISFNRIREVLGWPRIVL
jgi:hypothetical protein